MKTGRRFFLSGFTVALAGTRALLANDPSQRNGPPPQIPPPMQLPDASGTGSVENFPPSPRSDPKLLLKEDQKTIRKDVDRLLQLAKDLKQETDKTPETDVLSVSLVKKAEEIEKLARQIKDRIREN